MIILDRYFVGRVCVGEKPNGGGAKGLDRQVGVWICVMRRVTVSAEAVACALEPEFTPINEAKVGKSKLRRVSVARSAGSIRRD